MFRLTSTGLVSVHAARLRAFLDFVGAVFPGRDVGVAEGVFLGTDLGGSVESGAGGVVCVTGAGASSKSDEMSPDADTGPDWLGPEEAS